MAIRLYCRVSTQGQHFAQQMQDITNYFDAHGIRMEDVAEVVEEKESGGKSYEDRKLQQLLNRCKPGDTIYVASTDRLGRNFVDMIRMMEAARKRGIVIVACKQGLSLADDNMATKIILSVTAIIDEDERMRIRHRVKNGVSAAIYEITKCGERTTKRGTTQTHWGNSKGTAETKRIMAIANEASCRAKQDAAIRWRESSAAYKMVREWLAMGKSHNEMLSELQRLYEHAPEKFGTIKGKCVTRSVLDRWCREMNQIAL